MPHFLPHFSLGARRNEPLFLLTLTLTLTPIIMSAQSGLTVADLGEQGVLQRLQKFCPPGVVGDDAAVLVVSPGRSLVVTTDVLVDGVHFSDATTSPQDVGWRAAAANLSDLAAMGAVPLGITVGLSVPGDLAIAWIEQLYQGMVDCLQPHGTAIVGGDVCRSSVVTVAITAFGQVAGDRTILRSTAQPGDAILITGLHGASRAGLELLLHPEEGKILSETTRQSLIQAHQRPQPRLDVIPLVWQTFTSLSQSLLSQSRSKPEPGGFRVAGMDSSDGLADAVLQICRASGVGAQLDRGQIPIPTGLEQWVKPEQLWEWVLYGGEDFELVLCLPEAIAQQVAAQLPGAALIGRITSNPTVVLSDSTAAFPTEFLTLQQGFQHF